MGTNHVKNIKCAFINIQSVGNKTIEIRELINNHQLDIFALAETWLNGYDHAIISEMTPSTHSFLQVHRENRRSGRVGIFISGKFSQIKQISPEKFT